jgi:hypothetical protein
LIYSNVYGNNINMNALGQLHEIVVSPTRHHNVSEELGRVTAGAVTLPEVVYESVNLGHDPYPSSASWNEVRHLRYDQCLAQARERIGEEVLAWGEPQRAVEKLFAPTDVFGMDNFVRTLVHTQHRTTVQDGYANTAAYRSAVRGIGVAVNEPHLDRRLRGLKSGERLHINSGRGYTFVAARERYNVSWKIVFDEHLSGSALDGAMDEFSASVCHYGERLSRTRDALKRGVTNGNLETYSPDVFSWSKDADDIISFLNMSNVAGEHVSSVNHTQSPVVQRAAVVEALYALPAHHGNETAVHGVSPERQGVYFDANGRIVKVLVPSAMPGVYLGLKPAQAGMPGDIEESAFHIGIEIDPLEVNAERGSQGHEGVTSFVETATAAQLAATFEAVGLQLSPRAQGIIAETTIERRFGHGYAHLTREIAKLVNDQRRDIAYLFNNADGRALEKLRLLESVEDPAAQIVIDLLKGVANRGAPSEGVPSLRITSNRIEMRDGSCKDIEYYIADGHPARSDQLLFWQSSYKRRTVMTLAKTHLNGVILPAGTLLAVEDDGYAMMRVTSYAFNDQEALRTFGVQEIENRQTFGGLRRDIIRPMMSS